MDEVGAKDQALTRAAWARIGTAIKSGGHIPGSADGGTGALAAHDPYHTQFKL